MERGMFDESEGNKKLEGIHEGMDVFDREGNRIGTVERVFLGNVSEETSDSGGGAATEAGTGPPRDKSLVDIFAEGFAGEEQMPDELQERLYREGFVRVDATGLFASDRYILPEQIASVSGDRVSLRVARDELIKRDVQ